MDVVWAKDDLIVLFATRAEYEKLRASSEIDIEGQHLVKEASFNEVARPRGLLDGRIAPERMKQAIARDEERLRRDLRAHIEDYGGRQRERERTPFD